MQVSTKYTSNTVNLSSDIPKAVSASYYVYMFAITGDNSEPITKPSFCWHVSNFS